MTPTKFLCPLPDLCEKGVVGDAGEEVPLGHVLGNDLAHELLEEEAECFALGATTTDQNQQKHFNGFGLT